MEGSGDQTDRLRFAERAVQDLQHALTEDRASTAQELSVIRADLRVATTAIGEMADVVKDLIGKVDETRTRRPDLIAGGMLLIALTGIGLTAMGGMWVIWESRLQPIVETVRTVDSEMNEIIRTRWTEADDYRTEQAQAVQNDQTHQDIRSELGALRTREERLEDRIIFLERERMRADG